MNRRVMIFVVMCATVSVMFAQQPNPVPPQQPAQQSTPQGGQGRSATGGETKAPVSIADKTSGMQKLAGYFPLYWDARAGKLWLEIDKWDQEFLYIESLPAGLGSNDIGLDRGQLGQERVVKFQRIGPKVLLVQVNYAFRANTDSAAERRSVEQAFAQSVLWGFEVAAEDGQRALVDATAFYMQDAHDVVGTLKRTRQGTFRLEASRSAFYLPRTKNFPQNTEVETTLTFVGDDPGRFLRDVTPTPQAVTVREHYSFVQLPDGNYKPRAFDPRAGFFGFSYMDFGTPVTEPITKRFITRHRLQKKDPSAPMSEPVKPIIYYLDPGTPEPVRSALLEGARWWNQAFEAAGYKDAFRVEMLPEDADPMDVRYNLIQWVHRATRGWSYGGGVTDPRTGEIIKGQVTLGSLRVRQDYLIFEGLLSPYEKGKPSDPRLLQASLARLRQLAAHEVGHTLGLSHNYIASTQGRASVMDYPHPLVKLAADGTVDLSDAYATGIGEWDKVTIAYGYQDFPAGTNEQQSLDQIIMSAMQRGLTFLTDQDARPLGSAHPQTHLWDTGTNAVDELNRMLQVRAKALERFGENAIREHTPLATLEEVLVPLYFHHRYQTEAAAKVLGGVTYTYAVRGDGQIPTTPVPADEQRRALKALLATLSPATLAVPERIAKLIPPHPAGYQRHRELFKSQTGLTFDPLGAADAAAHLTAMLILDSDRAARLVEHNARDPKQPSWGEVLDALLAATWRAPRQPGFAGEVQRTVEDTVLYDLMTLVADKDASAQVRAVASSRLTQLREWARTAVTADANQKAHLTFAAAQIKRFEDDPEKVLKEMTPPLEAPPGQPIGTIDDLEIW